MAPNQPDYQLGLMAGYQENRYSLQQKEALISIVVREASGMKRIISRWWKSYRLQTTL